MRPMHKQSGPRGENERAFTTLSPPATLPAGALWLPWLGLPLSRLVLRLLIPLGVITLAIIAAMRVHASPGIHPQNAVWIMCAITIGTAGVILWMQRDILVGPRESRIVPMPLHCLYLATVILVGTAGAVPLAAVVALYPLVPDMLLRSVRASRIVWALRRSAVAASTTLAAGAAYLGGFLILGVHGRQLVLTDPHAGLLGGTMATLVMLFGSSLSAIMDKSISAIWSYAAWHDFLRSPAFRYQVLLLGLGPLLPFVEILDDTEAELAWILFLVPLFAIYYLALLSFRHHKRTEELELTVVELKAARERTADLQGFATLVTRAQERERMRIANDLCEDNTQTLITVWRILNLFTTRPMTPPLSHAERRLLNDADGLTMRTLESNRRASQDLRPSVLDLLGLGPALASLVSATGSRDLHSTFAESGESGPVSLEVEMTVYRIAQEALANVVRHAHASHVMVELAYHSTHMQLAIRDDGCGFDVQQQLRSARASVGASAQETESALGLLGIRERAALIGGTVDIASTPGVGTAVSLRVPLGYSAPALVNTPNTLDC